MFHNSSLAQKSKISCRFISKKSGLALAISTDPETQGVAVLNEKSRTEQSLFVLERDNSVYKIQSKLTGQYLTVYYGLNTPGSMIVTLPCFEHKSQRFSLKYTEIKNEYQIQTFCGLLLDCFQEGTEIGTRIIQWTRLGKPHQIWKIQIQQRS